MARILNIDIPDNKHICIGLTAIYGIGKSLGLEICNKANIDPSTKTKDLSEDQLKKLRSVILEYKTEGELRREKAFNVKRLLEIASYKGIRHRKGLPVNGQSTKRNARTRKGSKKTVANKKKAGM